MWKFIRNLFATISGVVLGGLLLLFLLYWGCTLAVDGRLDNDDAEADSTSQVSYQVEPEQPNSVRQPFSLQRQSSSSP